MESKSSLVRCEAHTTWTRGRITQPGEGRGREEGVSASLWCSDPIIIRRKQFGGQQNGGHTSWDGFHAKPVLLLNPYRGYFLYACRVPKSEKGISK